MKKASAALRCRAQLSWVELIALCTAVLIALVLCFALACDITLSSARTYYYYELCCFVQSWLLIALCCTLYWCLLRLRYFSNVESEWEKSFVALCRADCCFPCAVRCTAACCACVTSRMSNHNEWEKSQKQGETQQFSTVCTTTTIVLIVTNEKNGEKNEEK